MLGLLLLLVAVKEWRGRPHEGEEARSPKWMGAMAQNNAAIMATVLLILGVKLIGDAIAGFS